MPATPIPSARVTFFDRSGAPLVGGSVTYYVPGTLSKKITWADSNQMAVNPNPITLDALGQASVWGVGSYREIVLDILGATISDSVTIAASSYGMVSGSDLTAAVKAEVLADLPGQIATALSNMPIQGLN